MKTIIFLTAILLVHAQAIQLSAENVTVSTDSAQQGITGQRRGTVTTANQEGKGYLMASHVTGLYSTGNIVSESDESTPTGPLVGSQGTSNETALPDNQKLPDDDKNGGNNVSRASSVREFQPTPTSAFAFPSDSKNLLQHNTNAVGPDNGQMQTFHSQNGGYVQRTDTMNSEEWSGGDIATTVLATNDHHSVATMKPTDTNTFKELSYEDFVTTLPRANDAWSITTMQPIYTNHFEEQSHEGFTTPFSRTNDDRSITTMQPIDTNNFEEQSDEEFGTPVPGNSDDQSVNAMQPTDANNSEGQSYEDIGTTVLATNDDQSVTTMKPTDTNTYKEQSNEDIAISVPGANVEWSITNMQPIDTNNFEERTDEDLVYAVLGNVDNQSVTTVQPTYTNNSENQSGEDIATQVPETIGDHLMTTIQPIDTNNIKEQRDEDFAPTVPRSNDEETFTAAVATLPTTLARNEYTMDQNGAPKGTTSKAKQEHEYEEVTKKQYFNFIPSDETNSFMDQRASTAQAPISSPSLLLTTPGDVENHVQQNGKPQNTQFNANYDDSNSNPQYVHFIPHTGTEIFGAPLRQSSVTSMPPVQDVGTIITSPTVPVKVPDDENDVMQQNGDPNNTKVKANYDDLLTTRTQDVDLISHSITNTFEKQEGELNDTSPSSAQDVEATTLSPSKLLIVPGAEEGHMQQKIVPTPTKFKDDYDDIWPTTPQYEDFTPTTSKTLSIIRINEASVTQQSGESTNPTSIAYFDAELTTRPKNDNIKPLTDTKSSNEQYEEFSTVTTSVAQGVGMTTTPTPINDDPTSTIFELAYDNTEQATTAYELVTPSPGTKNSIEEVDEMSSIMALPTHDNLLPNSSPPKPTRVKSDNESDIQLKGDSVGRQNISLTFKPNEDEPTTTPSSIWFSLPDDDKNLILEGDISRGTTMSFLTIFKILTAVNDNHTLIDDSPIVTTVLPIYEENFASTTAIPDVMTIPTYEEMDVNETKIETPSNTERSPQELLILFEIHFKMLRVMSITLAIVVALVILKLGYKYLRKRRRGDHTAVPPESAAAEDAAQPSTSQTSNTEELGVKFSDLLAREENL